MWRDCKVFAGTPDWKIRNIQGQHVLVSCMEHTEQSLESASFLAVESHRGI